MSNFIFEPPIDVSLLSRQLEIFETLLRSLHLLCWIVQRSRIYIIILRIKFCFWHGSIHTCIHTCVRRYVHTFIHTTEQEWIYAGFWRDVKKNSKLIILPVGTRVFPPNAHFAVSRFDPILTVPENKFPSTGGSQDYESFDSL